MNMYMRVFCGNKDANKYNYSPYCTPSVSTFHVLRVLTTFQSPDSCFVVHPSAKIRKTRLNAADFLRDYVWRKLQ